MKNLGINKKIFEKEIAQCKKLSKKNSGKCNWGKCDFCGVVPLLYKLFSGEIFEKEDKVKKIRQKALGKIHTRKYKLIKT